MAEASSCCPGSLFMVGRTSSERRHGKPAGPRHRGAWPCRQGGFPPPPPCLKVPKSVRYQAGQAQGAQDTVSRTAQNEIAHPGVTEASHHEEVGVPLNGLFLNRGGDRALASLHGLRLGWQATLPQALGKAFTRIALGQSLIAAYGQYRNLRCASQQWSGIGHGPRRGAASVPGDRYMLESRRLPQFGKQDRGTTGTKDDIFRQRMGAFICCLPADQDDVERPCPVRSNNGQ